jgi:CRISPR-associated endonuclease Csn1
MITYYTKSRLFDDSFLIKLFERQLNIDKSNKTAYSFTRKIIQPDFDQFEKKLKFVW